MDAELARLIAQLGEGAWSAFLIYSLVGLAEHCVWAGTVLYLGLKAVPRVVNYIREEI